MPKGARETCRQVMVRGGARNKTTANSCYERGRLMLLRCIFLWRSMYPFVFEPGLIGPGQQ